QSAGSDRDAPCSPPRRSSDLGDTVGITASSSDPGGEAVSYALTDDAGGAFTIDSSTGVVTVADHTKLADLGGSASITVQASEADDVGGAASVTHSFTLNVTEPSLTAITDSDATSKTLSHGA